MNSMANLGGALKTYFSRDRQAKPEIKNLKQKIVKQVSREKIAKKAI